MTAKAPLSRIERRKIEFKEKITTSALKLFEGQGVADTSVASIIKDADIAHKTFFNHFPTKDHLLRHIVSTFSEYAYSAFREDFKRDANPKKRIEYCFLEIAKALEPLPPHYKELINLYLISGTSDLRRSQKEKFSAVINQIINDAKSEDMLRPDFSPDTLSDMVIGICISTLLDWCVEEDFPLMPKMKRAIKFINGSIFVEG